ncbi:hypothetical protein BCR43DRAFT_498106 [Syncephalastrum racemosum]|uniref:BHLH domain-containing protein n=1 Tax=Syncephalastrum racemosum TaxID=13706 RepID=A0A1X2H3J4_SYNRA|nr:hypothetical protein BCR43DRAFT_498106 [Syncephalastrum racemosum]
MSTSAQQQQHAFVTQAYAAYDPAAGPMYYNVPPPNGIDVPQHHRSVAAYPQFNFQFSPSHQVQPQHQHHARRLQQLQQQAAIQQQQALYHQQMLAYQQHHSGHHPPSPGKRLQTKAERRAEHNAIERARRETLNTKFQQLAHSLPNLQNDRRPSKGTIIERTLDFVKNTVQKEERYITIIRKLREENDTLQGQIGPGANDIDEQCPSFCSSSTASTASIAPSNDDYQKSSISASRRGSSSTASSASSPAMVPSFESSAAAFFDASTAAPGNWDNLMIANTLHNDVMFGQPADRQHLMMFTSPGSSPECDSDDNSSTNIDDIDLRAVSITNHYSSMSTLAPGSDCMKSDGFHSSLNNLDFVKMSQQQQQRQD